MTEYKRLETSNQQEIEAMSELAGGIVKEHYDPIIGADQNDYMIAKFQSAAAIKEQLEHGYQYYFVCKGQEAIGFLAFYKRENELYLSKFYLKKQMRGQGISKEMLCFIRKCAERMQVNTIVLNVNRNNPAIYAYEKLGFVKVREEKNEIGHGFIMDDYVYQRQFEGLGCAD